MDSSRVDQISVRRLKAKSLYPGIAASPLGLMASH